MTASAVWYTGIDSAEREAYARQRVGMPLMYNNEPVLPVGASTGAL